MAKFVRPALLGKVHASQVDDDLKTLWEATIEEAGNKSWMCGPLSVEDVHGLYPSGWLPVRRFGVWQSSGDKMKLRAIDDYSENRVNSAYSYMDRITLRTLDQVVWCCAAIVRMSRVRGEVCLQLASGEVLRGPLHSSLQDADNSKPLVSVLDLSSAYKQLALHPASRKYSIVTLKNPSNGATACFEGRVLPFGATSSVVNFNRVSRLLQRVGFELDLLWGNYFDDFPVISVSALAESSTSCMITLMRLLGFVYAEHKLAAFSERAAVLGVELDLSCTDDLSVLVRNKPGRVRETLSMIDEVVQSRQLNPSTCSRLLGRIQYADGQIMGRVGRLAMTSIREAVKRNHGPSKIDDSVVASLTLLAERLDSGEPRTISCSDGPPPILIFTDGASEGDSNTVGGFLINRDLDVVEFFACNVPDTLVRQWQVEMKHIIGPVELYGVVLARHLWHTQLVGKHCLYFVDNYAAMDACIRGSSGSPIFRQLLLSFEKDELQGQTWYWFTRVPSPSNAADEPSRSKLDGLVKELQAQRASAMCPLTGERLSDL